MNNRLVHFTKVLLDVMYYSGRAVTILIPFIFQYAGKYIEAYRKFYIIQCIIYMVSGYFCLLIVYELRKMFITVLNEDAFVDENAVSLKKMGKYSFIISLISFIRLPIAPTPATMVVVIVFAIAGLFSVVLCQVFEKAIQYKLENDLTI